MYAYHSEGIFQCKKENFLVHYVGDLKDAFFWGDGGSLAFENTLFSPTDVVQFFAGETF